MKKQLLFIVLLTSYTASVTAINFGDTMRQSVLPGGGIAIGAGLVTGISRYMIDSFYHKSKAEIIELKLKDAMLSQERIAQLQKKAAFHRDQQRVRKNAVNHALKTTLITGGVVAASILTLKILSHALGEDERTLYIFAEFPLLLALAGIIGKRFFNLRRFNRKQKEKIDNKQEGAAQSGPVYEKKVALRKKLAQINATALLGGVFLPPVGPRTDFDRPTKSLAL